MQITCGDKTMTMSTGTTAMRCLLSLCGEIPGVLAAQCVGEAIELNQPVEEDCTLIPLTLKDEEGRRIYERSLRFVMLLALRRLYPGQQVRIEYSVGDNTGHQTSSPVENYHTQKAERHCETHLAEIGQKSHTAAVHQIHQMPNSKSQAGNDDGRL